MQKTILILGVNGFIGSHLTDTLLRETSHRVVGLDLHNNNLQNVSAHDRFEFRQGNMLKESEWIEKQIAKADCVLPLVAIATPSTYVSDPLKVFELDFEANLPIVRACVRHKKRLIFPSTSEVYGMCTDTEFDEESSNFILGPINKPRWIYSCSKQLMDRVISAYGTKENLAYTLFRPFNWIGPRQDNIHNTAPGGSRVLTQFIGNMLRGESVRLVNGGLQTRCFTYIQDGIDALVKIIENKDHAADQKIFNIGNPHNNHSIKELADTVFSAMQAYAEKHPKIREAKIIVEPAQTYYGAGYQDVERRVPAIAQADQYLQWKPLTDFATAIQKTVDYYLK